MPDRAQGRPGRDPTCCVLGLPYLSSVAYLPAGVFFRCYSLYFLEQLGLDFKVIFPADDPSRTPTDYDRWPSPPA